MEKRLGLPKYDPKGGKWSSVVDHKLTEDDVYEVYEEVITMAGNWGQLAIGFRLLPRMKSIIALKHSNSPEQCLFAVVEEWLKGLHNVQKYGHPSWRALVRAVADPTGGANPALAQAIADKHPVTSAPGGGSDANGRVVAHSHSQVSSAPGGGSDAMETVETTHKAQTAVSTSAMGGYGIDPRKCHHLSAKFSKMLHILGSKLNECVDLDALKNFLNLYSHPLYPDKRYIEPLLYCDAKVVADIVFSLFPRYINYMEHYILEEIVDGFGDKECRRCFQEYEQLFQRSVGKLRDHPAPVTEEEAEQFKGQTRLRVTTSGDVRATTPHDLHTVQEAIEQATGVSRAGQVYAHQDPGNSVTFTLLIPDCVVQLFHELCGEDLTVLADAGITRIQVEDWEIGDINKYTTKGNAAQITYSSEESIREAPKPSSLEYHLKERQNISSQQCADLIAMLRRVPDRQLNEVCSEQLLLQFSRHIQKWRELAPFLGMQDFYHDEFTARYPGHKERNYQLLLFWRRREGSMATYCHLLETIILHGTRREVRALIKILFAGPAADTVSKKLKEQYIQHANSYTSDEDGLQVDTRMVQLKEDASDELRELDYCTRLETAEEFRDEVESVSLEQVMNIISAARPGTCIPIAGLRGIGKTPFIRRMCHCWALGYVLRQYRLLFSIDLSTAAAGQPLNDLSDLVTAALTSTQAFTEAEIRSVLSNVAKKGNERVLVVLDHFSQQHNRLLSSILSSKWVTVLVCSSHAVKHVGHEYHFHMLGLTDRQISQQVLHYCHGDHCRAEHFLQYLSSVPNFSILKRVPVYLYGLLYVFDSVSTAPPPRTLTSFLSCLALLMLNLPQSELNRAAELLTSKSILNTLSSPPSPSWPLFQMVCQIVYKKSKSLFHRSEPCMVAWPAALALMRPVHIALPLQSGEWLLLTQHPLLQDFLASLHLCGLQQPVEETLQYLDTHKELLYFCWKLMPHIQTEVEERTETNYFMTVMSHSYEDNYFPDRSSHSKKLHVSF